MKRQQLLDTLGTPDHRFSDTLGFIDAHYLYQPSGFDNGPVRNNAGENQGSCKVLAMALDLGLDDLQALQCFAEHYQSVLANPDGQDHANIRALRDHGLAAVKFDSSPLTRR
ncbi:HopJ type III effector protein [Halopseudomonas salina]|uniref:Type III effector protein n=1 Tax=Halopseudomonas salina TaxID=1323744 RepID=A0ABQ1Q315_9GAMM|nr:HopJ type III effector protein [Halopseudomonas salina]GGD11155.1 type III effector protein [Halopseudomonas salina]